MHNKLPPLSRGRLQFAVVRLPHPVICSAAIIYHFRRHLARLRPLGGTEGAAAAAFLSWMALRLPGVVNPGPDSAFSLSLSLSLGNGYSQLPIRSYNFFDVTANINNDCKYLFAVRLALAVTQL